MLEHRTKWKWTCKCIDFERDVQEFKILDEPNLGSVVDNLSDSMQALEINASEVLHNSIKTETEEAKQKELASWIQEMPTKKFHVKVKKPLQHVG